MIQPCGLGVPAPWPLCGSEHQPSRMLFPLPGSLAPGGSGLGSHDTSSLGLLQSPCPPKYQQHLSITGMTAGLNSSSGSSSNPSSANISCQPLPVRSHGASTQLPLNHDAMASTERGFLNGVQVTDVSPHFSVSRGHWGSWDRRVGGSVWATHGGPPGIQTMLCRCPETGPAGLPPAAH